MQPGRPLMPHLSRKRGKELGGGVEPRPLLTAVQARWLTNEHHASLKLRPRTGLQVRSFCPEGRGDIGSWLLGELNLRPSGCGTAATGGQHAYCELMSV